MKHKSAGSPQDAAKSAGAREKRASVHEHYQRPSHYQSEDVYRVLGDPRESAGIAEGAGLHAAAAARHK